MFSCRVKILKGCKHIISQPLANIYNLSVIQGKHPSKLKLAKIVPVYKDDDESCASNYRSISLLSIFNRIFAKQHAILDIVNTIQSNMKSGKFTCGLFTDLKKAFDTVDHYILFQKLDFYGIRGIVNDWFRSYLTYRKQTTSNGSYISNSETTLYGVPQGSVLAHFYSYCMWMALQILQSIFCFIYLLMIQALFMQTRTSIILNR